jgi:hypothetical protein
MRDVRKSTLDARFAHRLAIRAAFAALTARDAHRHQLLTIRMIGSIMLNRDTDCVAHHSRTPAVTAVTASVSETIIERETPGGRE